MQNATPYPFPRPMSLVKREAIINTPRLMIPRYEPGVIEARNSGKENSFECVSGASLSPRRFPEQPILLRGYISGS